ncbi:MAG: hypothetical protein C4542_03025 [Dehalococcoidia bacterium]|nr:MAG: hypothetical protein C4542_03025 [Dehalococcoidia bacterium]
MKPLILALLLLPVALAGQVTPSLPVTLSGRPIVLLESYYPTYEFYQRFERLSVDPGFRSCLIQDYSDAVKYQDWHHMRRIARLLTWMNPKNTIRREYPMGIIEQARRDHRIQIAQEHREWQERERQWDKDHKERADAFKSNILPHLRPATVNDYRKWIVGFISNGGTVTHHYDYDMPDDVYIALDSFEITPLYGASSINVIVPAGIEVNGDAGHSNLYFMDGFKARGSWIPAYNNVP